MEGKGQPVSSSLKIISKNHRINKVPNNINNLICRQKTVDLALFVHPNSLPSNQ